METIIAVGIAIVLTAAITSGIWIMLKRRSSTSGAIQPEDKKEYLQEYQARLQSIPHWNKLFSELQAALAQAKTLPEMAQGFKQVFMQENVKSNIVLAIGPIRDFALLDTLGSNVSQIALTQDAFIISYPEIEKDVCHDFAQKLYQALQQHADSPRHWWTLRELAPTLQDNLLKHYHIAGQGMITPLRYKGTLYGFSFVAGPQSSSTPDLVRDTGERIAVTGDMLSTWLRCMAPQMLAGTSESNVQGLPLDLLASLDGLEQSIAALQEDAESQEMLGALAEYSHFSMLHIAETSLLATQTCASLRRICQADFAMVLLPNDTGTFAVEAIEMDNWTWSHYRALQGMTTSHPLIRDERVLKSWPDAFAQQHYDTGESFHSVKQGDVFVTANRLAALGLESVLVKPATLGEHCLALLVIGLVRPGGFPEQVLSVIASVAAITGMGLKTMQSANERSAAIKSLNEAWTMSSALAKQAVEVISTIATTHGILAVRSPELVAQTALAIAQQMSIPKTQLFQVRLAALACDIGMIAIPSNVLRKEGGFTPEEWKVVQSHPQVSINMLKTFSIFKEALPMILHHHERWNGTGYPDQLKGADIPIGARIIGVADTYISMQTKRFYRGALTAAEAMAHLQQEAGVQFDPDIIKALIRALKAENSGREIESQSALQRAS